MLKKLALITFSALIFAACSPNSKNSNTPSTNQSASNATITITGFAFTPQSINVKAGSKVLIQNNDSVNHTLTGDDNSFDSGTIASNQVGSITAPSQPGTYTYHCSVHSNMTGTLVVQ